MFSLSPSPAKERERELIGEKPASPTSRLLMYRALARERERESRGNLFSRVEREKLTERVEGGRRGVKENGEKKH